MAQVWNFETFIILLVILAAVAFVGYTLTLRRKKPEENPYQEALEHLADGNDKLAIQKFREAIRQDSENVTAYIRLGDLLRKRGMVDHAVKIHKDLTFRSNLSAAIRKRVYRSLLLDYELLQDPQSCIRVARKFLELDRVADKFVAQKLVESLEKTSDWVEAFEASKKYLNVSNPIVKRKMALYLVFQGLQMQEDEKGKDARLKYKEALKIDPTCTAAYYYLGKSYRQEDRLEDAIVQWKKLCDKVPGKAYIVFSELEKAWFEMGRFNDVENLYQALMTKHESNLNAGLALADIFARKGEFEHALEILELLRDQHDEHPALIAGRVNIYFLKGQYKMAATEAQGFFEKSYQRDKTSFQCQICSFSTDEPEWICPQCQSIDSFNI